MVAGIEEHLCTPVDSKVAKGCVIAGDCRIKDNEMLHQPVCQLRESQSYLRCREHLKGLTCS